MRSAVEGQGTTSDKIRALAARGATRSEIASFLGKSYQHVRQVLVEDERRRGSKRVGVADAGRSDDCPSSEMVSGPGGSTFVRLTVDPEGRMVLPPSTLRELGLRGGDLAIGRVQDGELVISSAESAMRNAQAIVQAAVPPDVSLADELLADRRREAGE